MTLLVISDFRLWLDGKAAPVLDGVSLTVAAGQIVALVGESGAGKTLLMRAASGALPSGARWQGRVQVGGVEIAGATDWAALRGRSVVSIPQVPRAGLSPVRRVGAQIGDALRLGGRSRHEAAQLLAELGLGAGVASQYPDTLSGGMVQRVAVARAMATGAALVLADEPTSALDGPAARQVLAALARARDAGRGVLLITHDVALAATVADRIAVLHAGQLVETGRAAAILDHPLHPYTRAMLAALPARAQTLAALIPLAPTGADPAAACRYAPRCPLHQARCRSERPPLRWNADRALACHHGEP